MLDENAAFRVRRKAGVVWAFRARAELDAHAQFARLAETLANAGAANEIVDMATAASEDEARHAVLCERLVQHFGATLIEGTPPPTNPIGPAHLGRRERALYVHAEASEPGKHDASHDGDEELAARTASERTACRERFLLTQIELVRRAKQLVVDRHLQHSRQVLAEEGRRSTAGALGGEVRPAEPPVLDLVAEDLRHGRAHERVFGAVTELSEDGGAERLRNARDRRASRAQRTQLRRVTVVD